MLSGILGILPMWKLGFRASRHCLHASYQMSILMMSYHHPSTVPHLKVATGTNLTMLPPQMNPQSHLLRLKDPRLWTDLLRSHSLRLFLSRQTVSIGKKRQQTSATSLMVWHLYQLSLLAS